MPNNGVGFYSELIYIIILFFSGCPLVSFKQEMTSDIDKLDQADREVVCETLFHTVNWFREVCGMHV